MAEFDPDAYLSNQDFDPDAYLNAQPKKPAPNVMTREAYLDAVEKRKGEKPWFGRGSTISDIAGGIVKGATDIGTTLITPIDMALGNTKSWSNPERRQSVTDFFQNSAGMDVNSLGYAGGRIASNVAGTAGVPAVMARGAQVAGASAPIVTALRSGGFVSPGTSSTLANAALRTGAGAAVGGASAGLVNPEDAGMGAIIGGALPGVAKGAVEVGRAVGARAAIKNAESAAKFARTAPIRETLKESIEAGYVVPPNMVQPSFKNALVESFSGKQATAQMASVKNQDVTEKLVRQALGLADDAPLTKNALEQIRKVEGGAYKKVAGLSPAAEMDLEALKQARNEAQGWFNAYNRSASPDDLAKAKNFRDTAEVLELQLESHAKNAGKESLIPELRAARKQIAKTYTVERALNDASGTVNAKVLGRIYEKGSPLSDGLDVVGKFASAFPSVAQPAQQFGSPAAHNLRAMASMAASGGGYAAMGPIGIAAGAAPFIAGPTSRAIMFRKGAQQALANQAPPSSNQYLIDLLRNEQLQRQFLPSVPVLATSGP